MSAKAPGAGASGSQLSLGQALLHPAASHPSTQLLGSMLGHPQVGPAMMQHFGPQIMQHIGTLGGMNPGMPGMR